MRTIIFSALAFLSSLTFAGILPGKSLPSSGHALVKEFPQDDLDAGTCKIIGHVYQDYDVNSPMNGVLISTLDKEKMTYSDTLGYYEIVIDAKDTSIFAFKSEYAEHVIWNIEFKERYVYEINFFLSTDYGMIEVDKPVIYLYNEEELSVNIEFIPIGELAFCYPELNRKNGWEVTVKDDKIFANNRLYPYLFWESRTNELPYDRNDDQVYGQLIETKSVVAYLEASLTQLGLNHTEQTDFITYWLPKLQSKKYAFIQFIIDDHFQNVISEMKVTPTPDSMRRVFMLFTLFDVKPDAPNYVEQELPSFERNGFTLIEWGGSQKDYCPIFKFDEAD